MGNSVFIFKCNGSNVDGEKVRNIASIAQKNQSSVVVMVSQFVKGAQDLRSLQKKNGPFDYLKE